jgi:hypothetical protein
VIFYARDGCESFYTAKTLSGHRGDPKVIATGMAAMGQRMWV